MATSSWSNSIDHSSDATFRAWGSDFSSHLATIGLVQTSDTGQINWATVARPSTNTMAGYEIWRFNDSLQATAPIYFKLEYGTSGAATRGAFALTVGTGSNGSGTITGTVSTRTVCAHTANYLSAVTNYPSYACAVEGAAWMAFRVGSMSTTPAGAAAAHFGIFRYNDTDGTPNSKGFVVYVEVPNSVLTMSSVQSVRTASPATVFAADTSGMFCLFPHADTNSSITFDTGDLQVFAHWTPTRRSSQLAYLCSYINSEISQGSTFSTTIIGASPRSFIAAGGGFGYGGIGTGTVTRIALVWE